MDIRLHSVETDQPFWLNLSKLLSLVFIVANLIDLIKFETLIRNGIDKVPEYSLTEKEQFFLQEWTDPLNLTEINGDIQVSLRGLLKDKTERKLYYIRNVYRWISILAILVFMPYLMTFSVFMIHLINLYMAITYLPKILKKNLFKKNRKV